MGGEANNRSLLRSAVLDHGHLAALERLIFGPLSPDDLPLIEQSLRAFITVEQLRPLPLIAAERGDRFDKDILDEESAEAPIGDHVLDYEFIYEPTWVPILPALDKEEKEAIDRLALRLLEKAFGKSVYDISIDELANVLDPVLLRYVYDQSWFVDNEARRLNLLVFNSHGGLDRLTLYAHTLIRFHRAGAIVFAQGLIGEACQSHLFSHYPSSIFDQLDKDWHKYIRQIIGPGVGVVVPPILACVLSRVNRRDDIPLAVRDIRDEYRASRETLWNYLEEMWLAPSLKKQLKLLSQLEAASENLFKASFPERFRFLQTAFSTAIKVAELNPLSAMEVVGNSLLKKDEATSRVSAIGFTRQLSSDLRHIHGMSDLLRKILSKAEAAEFGLS